MIARYIFLNIFRLRTKLIVISTNKQLKIVANKQKVAAIQHQKWSEKILIFKHRQMNVTS